MVRLNTSCNHGNSSKRYAEHVAVGDRAENTFFKCIENFAVVNPSDFRYFQMRWLCIAKGREEKEDNNQKHRHPRQRHSIPFDGVRA